MNRTLGRLSAATLFAAALMVLPAMASAAVVYNAVPASLPPNVASVGFQANQTAQFGDYVHLGGTDRNLTTVMVTMSDWALYSDYTTDARYSGNSTSWTHPITLNIYNVVPGSPNTVGSLLGTVTQTITIPWRPVADPTCPGGTAWRAGDGNCYNGKAFNATFDLSSLNITLPNDIIVGIAYNTNTWGAAPIGLPGPYESLNVGVTGAATVGTDDNTGKVFWNTSTAGNYTDGGTAGVGIFREDTNWAPNGTTPLQINAISPTGSINITKYACPDGTVVTRANNGVGGTVPAGCALQSGKTFGYVHGTQTDANAPFPELSTPLTAAGTTSGSGVLNIPSLPATGRYLVVETDGSNQQLAAGDILGLYCEGDGDTSGTNDNQELTFVHAGGTVNCVAYNKAVAPVPSVTTNPATVVTSTGATLNGTNGPVAADNTSFWWGTTSAGPFTAAVDPSSEFPAGWTHDAGLGAASASGPFSEPLTGLTSGTTYYFAAWSLVGGTWYPGAVLSFATPTPAPTFLKVHILKYLDNQQATNSSAGGYDFPMTATWSAPSGSGSGNYVLGNFHGGAAAEYGADTSNMQSPANYSTAEVTTGNSLVLPTSASCVSGKYRLLGYKTSATSFANAATQATSTSAAFTGLTADQYVLVYDETCATTPPPPPANACSLTQAPAGYTLRNGTTGNDTVTLAPNTMFVGKGGNDKVNGGDGNYIVCTGNGNDTITLGNGNSTIDAGGGNNTVTVGNGQGTIMTAAGNDIIVAGDGARTVDVGNGNNTVTTGDGAQTITAGSGNDTIHAGGGDDTVNAGGGNNQVWGEAGNDMLTAAAGNDKLDGGAGTDTCQAGGGNNTKTSCEL